MFQSFKNFLWVVGLASGLQSASAFTLLGPIANPPETWQVSAIGYGIAGDLGAPKNRGEEYRRNTPVMYYACNANFIDYFGTNGMNAVDQAFGIFNALTNVDDYNYTDYSAQSLFPFDTRGANPTALSLNLLDLKSYMMFALMEQMGLGDSIRFTWCLKNRYVVPGYTNPCPAGIAYSVIQRNFDPITWNYTNKVNNATYSYQIVEYCNNSPPPEADAVEFSSDPTAYTPVTWGTTLGGYYTGLTWDDVGGLRYLLSSNNINTETAAPGSLLLSSSSSGLGGTNLGDPFLLYTSNYTTLSLIARTTDPVTLSNLFPGLVIASSSYSFSNILVPNYVVVTQSVIGAPAGTLQLVIQTNAPTSTIVTNYVNTFANVVIVNTNNFHTNTSVMVLTVEVRFKIGAPAGTLETVTNRQYFTLTNVPSGDYYISTNPCGPHVILSTLATNVTGITNLIVEASTSTGLSITQSLVILFTNHVLIAQPIICSTIPVGGTVAGATGLYEGVQNIKFVRAGFDSLLGQTFQPITNIYTMTLITNNQAVKQTFQRIVTAPDFVISAADLDPGGENLLPRHFTFDRNINFNQANVYPGLAGPGTITPPTTITFNKVGNIYIQSPNVNTNDPPGDQTTQIPLYVWGSFDASTNIIGYPVGTSIQDLSNQLLIRISPTSLSNGTNGVAYASVTFTTTGGSFTPPYTWSLVPGSGQLPPGLTLSSGGTLSGTPTQFGTFSFILQLTDAATRYVQWSYSITIQ